MLLIWKAFYNILSFKRRKYPPTCYWAVLLFLAEYAFIFIQFHPRLLTVFIKTLLVIIITSVLSQPLSCPVSLILFYMLINYFWLKISGQWTVGFFCPASRLELVLTWPPIEWLRGFIFQWIEWTGFESYHIPPYILEVKNVFHTFTVFTAQTFTALSLFSAYRAVDLRIK